MAHYDVFREHLGIRYPAFGHALWNPSPGLGEYGRVEIGDVGFIRQGRFHRLFNALLQADDESQRLGAPEHHDPFRPDTHDHITTSTLPPGHYCSVGVSAEGPRDLYALGPEEFPEVSFSCARTQGGAVLSIPVPAHRQDTLANGDFGTYMTANIDRWFSFTQQLGLGITRMEEIIFVTGRDCVRSWATVAFLKGGTDAQVSFGVKVSGESDIEWRYRSGCTSEAALNRGPAGRDLPENQCIFIRGLRVARTFRMLPKRIKAAAEASGPDENDNDRGTEPTSVSPSTKSRDPLLLLSDYVAEIGKRAIDCDMFLIHDDDLARTDGMCDGTSLQALRLDIMMGHLRRFNLNVYQVKCDLLSTESSSDVSPRMFTVATLCNAPKGPYLTTSPNTPLVAKLGYDRRPLHATASKSPPFHHSYPTLPAFDVVFSQVKPQICRLGHSRTISTGITGRKAIPVT